MAQQEDIKTLNGGSIDYAHYIAKGRAIRSQEAHFVLAAFRQWMLRVWKVISGQLRQRHVSVRPRATRCPLDRPASRSPMPLGENGAPCLTEALDTSGVARK